MGDQFSATLDPSLRQRLRHYAALRHQTITQVVNAALDAYLPSLAEVAAEIAQHANGADHEQEDVK